MKFGLWWREDDGGTKAATQRAYTRLRRSLGKEFIAACKEYWWHVYETARRLCIEYGAIDTWAMYESIRIVWEYEPEGGLYEVAISSAGVEMTAMIKVGGTAAINPKTGWFVDYAQAVHDGTRYMRARPFLTDAIIQSEVFLQMTLGKHIDRALTDFTRDY